MSRLKFEDLRPTNIMRKRSLILLAVTGLILFVFALMLLFAQILDKEEVIQSDNSLRTYSVRVEASRGSIMDRNGEPLVINSQGNSLVFNYSSFPDETHQQDRNRVIHDLISLFAQRGCSWTDELPIIVDESGGVAFDTGRDGSIAYLKGTDYLDLNSYATALDCMNALIKRYDLQEYSLTDARDIASVCYNMKREMFGGDRPYKFAEMVPTPLVGVIKENGTTFPGVDVKVEAYRYYTDGSVAPHVIGITGRINETEYAREKEATELALKNAADDEQKRTVEARAYSMDDTIGKNGIEGYYEEFLRGTDGTKTVSVDPDGRITEQTDVAPQAGDTVILTINKGLQKVAQESLEKRIFEVTRDESIAIGLPCAGAVVALDVKNADVLACATYPTFDLSTYYEDYEELLKTDGNPLWNRALQSAYAPGSTMKPCVALGALNEGAITQDTYFLCEGTYEISDMVFSCNKSTVHGFLAVREALKVSCNIFFFKVSHLLGIDKINEYASMFGLGEKTGLGIGEVTGNRASIAYRESRGGLWNVGDTMQAAIGQSDNQFTLIQLAVYCAAIANNGTRLVPHIVKSIERADGSGTVYEAQREVAYETGIDPSCFIPVKDGMHDVVTIGSVRSTFYGLDIDAAAKTGTSNKSLVVNGRVINGTNGFIIMFAPFDDPEIAVAVLLENAGSGSMNATIAADIMDYYFNSMTSLDPAASQVGIAD